MSTLRFTDVHIAEHLVPFFLTYEITDDILDTEVFEVQKLKHELTTAMHEHLGHKPISYHFSLASDEPSFRVCDSSRLYAMCHTIIMTVID